MAENGEMDALADLLKPFASGGALLGALRNSNISKSSDIPQLIAAVINEKLGAAPAPTVPAADAPRVSTSDALCVINGLMFISPRGKQQLALFADRCVVKTAKADISVPWSAIKHVAIIDSIPGDSKGKVLLYLHVASEARVMNGKAPLSAIVIQTTAAAQLDVAHPQGGGRLQGAAPVVLCQALGAVPGGVDPACFVSPDAQCFQSAALGAHPRAAGVAAFVKARQGYLYPLPSALCFLEAPALYLPHSAIRSMELMRAGGTSSTFDLVVHLCGGGVQEFGMVPREEAAGIEEYVRKCRLAVGAAESSEDEGAAEGGNGGGAAEAESGSDDDAEDEDFNPSSSSDDDEEEEGEGGQRQPPGRRPRPASGEDGAEGQEGAAAGAGAGQNEAEAEEEESDDDEEEDESSSEEESSDEDGSVELVSEDDFSMGQLESVMAGESSGSGRRAKRQRT